MSDSLLRDMHILDLLEANDDRSFPILSDRCIERFNKEGLLVEQPLTDIQLQPNSIDLTLGNTWKRPLSNAIDNQSGTRYINPQVPMKFEEGVFSKNIRGFEDMGDNEFYLVQPGEFVLMASNEILNIPNGIVSFICGRSSIARMGIQTEQAGFIDSGFRGTITLEVCNQTKDPLMLIAGMRVAQIYFIQARFARRMYGKDKGSKYNDQIEAKESLIHLDPEFRKER